MLVPSYYNCGVLDWMIVDAQSHVICRSTVKDAACAARSLEAGTQTWTGTPGLDVVAGPINHSAEKGFWTSASSLGAVTIHPDLFGSHPAETVTHPAEPSLPTVRQTLIADVLDPASCPFHRFHVHV